MGNTGPEGTAHSAASGARGAGLRPAERAPARGARLVLDWDGTVTERDSLVQVIERFGDFAVYEAAEERLGRDLTLHEVIALEVAPIRAPLDDVVSWVREHVAVRPGFRELARAYRPLILSSGLRELIEPVLQREGVALEVRANEVEPWPDGWRVRFRDDAVCAECGEPCKRAGLPGESVVFVGDGVSDHCAALAADRVFARDGLARYLEDRRLGFERFSDLNDVAAALR
jgi:2-hydroxy-3-keto-5-methylthiopentenyl-1-phosphate phosphatase